MNVKDLRESIVSNYKPQWAQDELRGMGTHLMVGVAQSNIMTGTGPIEGGDIVLVYLSVDFQTGDPCLTIIDSTKYFAHRFSMETARQLKLLRG